MDRTILRNKIVEVDRKTWKRSCNAAQVPEQQKTKTKNKSSSQSSKNSYKSSKSTSNSSKLQHQSSKSSSSSSSNSKRSEISCKSNNISSKSSKNSSNSSGNCSRSSQSCESSSESNNKSSSKKKASYTSAHSSVLGRTTSISPPLSENPKLSDTGCGHYWGGTDVRGLHRHHQMFLDILRLEWYGIGPERASHTRKSGAVHRESGLRGARSTGSGDLLWR